MEPGKSQKVQVTVPTRYVKGDYAKHIEIETNDPEAALVKLTIKAHVVESLVVVPATVNLGSVKLGSVNKRVVTITNKSKKPIAITKILAVPEKLLSVSHSGGIKLDPEKSFSVELSYSPSQPDDYFFGTLQIETDLPGVKDKIVRVQAKVVKE